ncbi:PLP-dependent aminotransferase family protein [Ralstonia sp. 25C]|uniref:aminotransferase-like domain-containing protein n=1 Tax=Ralstonia sp. 25C TaxID=3447363 RepID=UPI003F7500B5
MNLIPSRRSRLSQDFAAFDYSGGKHAINFAYGLPDPALFTELAWPDAFGTATGVSVGDLPQYTDAQGLPELRAQVALRHDVRQDQVILTNGASQAVQLLADLYLDPGDVVLTEDPSYLGALRTFSLAGATIVQLGMGSDGVDLDALEAALRHTQRVKLYYTTPAFHNPTGRHMPRAHMARVAALLAQHGVPLVQDLVYAELPYDGPAEWLSPGGNVINVHSISKVAGPGLRVGWVLAKPDIIGQLARLKCDGGVSPIVSNVVLGLMQSDALDTHIARLRLHYRAKRDALHRQLQGSRFCEPDYTVPRGGFSFWVRLAAGTDAQAFIDAARHEHDVRLVHGQHYGPASLNHVRLCFSYLPMSSIEQGLEHLDVLHARLYRPRQIAVGTVAA